jgi:hypothetical protein
MNNPLTIPLIALASVIIATALSSYTLGLVHGEAAAITEMMEVKR